MRKTGERLVDEVEGGHLARYLFAGRYIRGLTLDLGCGTGYGCMHLQNAGANAIVGLDIALEAVRYARRTHPRTGAFIVADATYLPFKDNAFDTVVSFELIEHLEDTDACLREITRVLKPNGICVISTPNKLLSSGGLKRPITSFHKTEFYSDQFLSLLRNYFDEVELFGQVLRNKSLAKEIETYRRGPFFKISRLISQIGLVRWMARNCSSEVKEIVVGKVPLSRSSDDFEFLPFQPDSWSMIGVCEKPLQAAAFAAKVSPVLLMNNPIVSIVVVNYKGTTLLTSCLRHLYSLKDFPNYELIVVDNCTKTHTLQSILAQFPHVHLIHNDKNLGYAAALNQGARAARGDYVLVMNNDVFPNPDCLTKMVKVAETESKIAVLGCKLFSDEKTSLLDSAGGIMYHPIGLAVGRLSGEVDPNIDAETFDTPFVSGAFMLVRKKAFDALGGFDELLFMAAEEMDFCWRARLLGFRVVCVTNATALHVGFASSWNVLPLRMYYHERNRIIANLKNLGSQSLPKYLLYELAFALMIFGGTLPVRRKEYLSAYIKAVAATLLKYGTVLRLRAAVQTCRKISEPEVLRLHTPINPGCLYSVLRNLYAGANARLQRYNNLRRVQKEGTLIA